MYVIRARIPSNSGDAVVWVSGLSLLFSERPLRDSFGILATVGGSFSCFRLCVRRAEVKAKAKEIRGPHYSAADGQHGC